MNPLNGVHAWREMLIESGRRGHGGAVFAHETGCAIANAESASSSVCYVLTERVAVVSFPFGESPECLVSMTDWRAHFVLVWCKGKVCVVSVGNVLG